MACKISLSSMKKYRTHNLDETAFLVIKGFTPKIKAIDGVSSEFVFEMSPTLKRTVKDFYATSQKVIIHTWLATRQMIKKDTQTSLKLQIRMGTNRRKLPPSPIVLAIETANTFHPKVGDTYYYVDVNRQIINNVFMATRIHQNRSLSNRCFRTKEEANNFAISTI